MAVAVCWGLFAGCGGLGTFLSVGLSCARVCGKEPTAVYSCGHNPIAVHLEMAGSHNRKTSHRTGACAVCTSHSANAVGKLTCHIVNGVG